MTMTPPTSSTPDPTQPSPVATTAAAQTLAQQINDAVGAALKQLQVQSTVYAVVDSIDTNATTGAVTLTITQAGAATSTSGIQFLSSYPPTVGDTVVCELVGTDLWVLGTFNPAAIGWTTGDLKYSALATAQEGWLVCDGSTHTITPSTQDLATELGYVTGTTFQVPDHRGKMPIGVGSVGTITQPTVTLLGGTANGILGETEVTLTDANLASHDHGGDTAVESAFHTHEVPGSYIDNGSSLTVALGGSGVGIGTILNPSSLGESVQHVHPISFDGSSTPFATMPPMIGLTVLIKT
jgi:microcystin-dependent protein